MMRLERRALNGIVLLDKATGISSHTALKQVQRLFSAKKAGHTGCLDPLATGLLPICFGEATKYIDALLTDNKVYCVRAKLGETRTTGDADGEVLTSSASVDLDKSFFMSIMEKFIGPILQVPPMYSALKFEGRPLYAYAREGITIPRKPRAVTVFSCELIEWAPPYFSLRVHCSKGTYIRSLIEDLGKGAHNLGAYVVSLRRESIDAFDNQAFYSLEELEHGLKAGREGALLLPIDFAVKALPKLVLDDRDVDALYQGQKLSFDACSSYKNGTIFQVYAEKGFFGTVLYDDHILKVKRLLDRKIFEASAL